MLQYAVTELQRWSKKWLLSLINKYCVLPYSRSVDKSITYTLLDHNDQELDLVKSDKVKYLGVWFDEKFSFRKHTQDYI